MDEKHTTWMFFAVIALTIANLIGWGRFNYALAEQGYLSDEFVTNWVAARTLITEGKSPYQPDVTRAILSALDADKSPAVEPVPQFTSPIYTIVLFLPIALIDDLIAAQAVWMSIQLLVLVGIILLAVYISPAKQGRLIFSLFVLTTFLSYHLLAPLLNGSTILAVSFFLLLALLLVRNGRQEMGGVFLGLTTIQLPYMFLPVILVLLWSLARRQRLVFLWFIGILVLLIALGVFIIPDWPLQYLRILFHFFLYYPISSPGAAFRTWWPGIGSQLAWILTLITVFVLLVEWWVALRGDFRSLLWAVAFTLSIGIWTGLPALPQNLILLLLPFILCVSAWSERWGITGSLIAVFSMIIVLVWEWWLVIANPDVSRQVDALKLLLPMPSICIIGLYWVRSIIVHPKSLLIDRIRSGRYE